jgi:hypothetical protein
MEGGSAGVLFPAARRNNPRVASPNLHKASARPAILWRFPETCLSAKAAICLPRPYQ